MTSLPAQTEKKLGLVIDLALYGDAEPHELDQDVGDPCVLGGIELDDALGRRAEAPVLQYMGQGHVEHFLLVSMLHLVLAPSAL